MFNIGFGELAVICIVLIIAVGPERLPSMMKTLGKTLRTLRQASRDIRASTGIDELLREDFDLYAPIKPSSPKPSKTSKTPSTPSLAPDQKPVPEPEAVPAALSSGAAGESGQAGPSAQQAPAAHVDADAPPTPVSREETVELPADRPSVVVAPPPQSIGAPQAPAAEPSPVSEVAEPAAPPLPGSAEANSGERDHAAAPLASSVDTLPRAPLMDSAPPSPSPPVSSSGPHQPPPADAEQLAQAKPTQPDTTTTASPQPQPSQADGSTSRETKQSGA